MLKDQLGLFSGPIHKSELLNVVFTVVYAVAWSPLPGTIVLLSGGADYVSLVAFDTQLGAPRSL